MLINIAMCIEQRTNFNDISFSFHIRHVHYFLRILALITTVLTTIAIYIQPLKLWGH